MTKKGTFLGRREAKLLVSGFDNMSSSSSLLTIVLIMGRYNLIILCNISSIDHHLVGHSCTTVSEGKKSYSFKDARNTFIRLWLCLICVTRFFHLTTRALASGTFVASLHMLRLCEVQPNHLYSLRSFRACLMSMALSDTKV